MAGILEALPFARNADVGRDVLSGKPLDVASMKNSKLVEEAKLNPTRIYHRPHDVLRDRRLNDLDRMEILGAWEREESDIADGETTDRLEEIRRARGEVEGRLPERRAAE